jgi:hypothetical protein
MLKDKLNQLLPHAVAIAISLRYPVCTFTLNCKECSFARAILNAIKA